VPVGTEPASTRTVHLVNKEGLHARPSQLIVEKANAFKADITLRIGENTADGKSILDLMMLASPMGTEIEIDARGEDAEEAVAALAALIGRGFGEEMA